MSRAMKACNLIVGVVGALLFAGPSSSAQAVPRTVKVEEAPNGMHWLLPKISQEVIKAFGDRVAANSYYTLTPAPAELVVVIVCLDSHENHLPGGFCTYRFEYHSKKIPEFTMPVGTPGLVARRQASEIADYIFEDFVKETTETRLSASEVEATLRVANFCSKPGNQGPCSGKFQ